MSSAVASAVPKTGGMAKDKAKKPSGGNHQTPRVNIGVPAEWHAVMRKLAARAKQPVLWYLIDLAAKEAEAAGVDAPPLPWSEESPA